MKRGSARQFDRVIDQFLTELEKYPGNRVKIDR